MTRPHFYLGTDTPGWLATVPVPLFVSRRRLDRQKARPRAIQPWALDSGGFTELHKYGEWRLTADEYAAKVRHYADEIGLLEWAAPQDWMCEESALAATRRTVIEHQRLTLGNFRELRDLLGPLVVPVLQGWSRDDYLRHVEDYAAAGFDLSEERVVGVGSICRRNADRDIGSVLTALAPLRVHAFGVKGTAFRQYAQFMSSADSMAWSASARFQGIKLPGCTHRGRTCSHCPRWALRWRESLLRGLDQGRLFEMAGHA